MHPDQSLPDMAKRKEATFRIPATKCAGCAERIERVLTRQGGVRSAEVRLDDNQADITYDADATDFEALQAVIEKAGSTPHPA